MTGVLFLAAVILGAAAQEIPHINPDGAAIDFRSAPDALFYEAAV